MKRGKFRIESFTGKMIEMEGVEIANNLYAIRDRDGFCIYEDENGILAGNVNLEKAIAIVNRNEENKIECDIEKLEGMLFSIPTFAEQRR